MKNQKMMKVFLLLLPAMAVLLATTADSVRVYDIPAETVGFYSYFALVPGSSLQICPPLAAIGAVISLILAVIYVVAGKMWSIDGVFYCSGLSAFAATLPVVYRGDVVLVPNVLLPILMLILCFLAYKARKRPEEKPAGIRLKQRK